MSLIQNILSYLKISGDGIPVERDFPPVQTGPGAHPVSYTMGTGSFPGVKYGRGVLPATHPLLVPWSWKGRAIPLPTLWATTGPVTGTLYLYLLVDNTSWISRIEGIVNILSCVGYMCRSVKLYKSHSSLIMIYYSLFHSIMSYGITF
jgi:hypothetical protein